MFIDFRKMVGRRERNIDQLPPALTPIRDQTWNLGKCPDQESNPQLFDAQDDAPTNWAP